MDQHDKENRHKFFSNVGMWMKLSRDGKSTRNKRCTQTNLGEHLGVTFQQIQKYEKNSNDVSLWNFIRLCDYFGHNPKNVIDTARANGFIEVKVVEKDGTNGQLDRQENTRIE